MRLRAEAGDGERRLRARDEERKRETTTRRLGGRRDGGLWIRHYRSRDREGARPRVRIRTTGERMLI
jgi:hypothetical protein